MPVYAAARPFVKIMEAEPLPRFNHHSTLIEDKLYVSGGRTKSGVSSSVHSYDPFLELWTGEKYNEVPLAPPGLYNGACASAGHDLYVCCGNDGSRFHSSLYQLDTKLRTWNKLSSGPMMRKRGSGMVIYDNKLVLFGGFGCPTGPTQPGAEFVKSDLYDAKNTSIGWTNELHTFNLKEGEYSDCSLVRRPYFQFVGPGSRTCINCDSVDVVMETQ
jgi:N-acetylneuraminic acid mutarotase